MRRLGRRHPCRTGKKRYSTLEWAATQARAFARTLNFEGKLSEDLYAYACPSCGSYHLTRQARATSIPVFTAPPVELQRWAMPKNVREEG